jgi:hypothetical protein
MSRVDCIEGLQLHNQHYGFLPIHMFLSTMSRIATLLAVHNMLGKLPYPELFSETIIVNTCLIRYHKGGTAQADSGIARIGFKLP